MVGTSIGADRRERALRTAWIGGAIGAGVTEAIGLGAAAFPRAWLELFGTDPTMVNAGSQYLQTVGPFYGFFGLGLVLYFASQGAGKAIKRTDRLQRSEEHTSELQSHLNLVCRLLLEKKKTTT